MARMPQARWLGEHAPVLSNGQRRRMLRYDIVCIHTIAGNAPAHAAHFSTHHDGRIEQSRDTRWQSGANLDGNHRVIAIENEDHGPGFKPWNINDGHAVPAFTAAQIEAIAQILAWAHQTHGIPLQLCPNSRSTSRGLAYHRQGIDGNFSDYAYPGRVAGGETWTKSRGKVCPGDRRISMKEEILTRAKLIIVGIDPTPPPPPTPPIGEYEMPTLYRFGSTKHRMIVGDRVVGISEADFTRNTGKPGFAVGVFDNTTCALLEQSLTAEIEPQEEAPPVP